MKFLYGAIASFIIALACPTTYAKSAPSIVDFDRLVTAPAEFDGKSVRVRGFLYVEPSHDVGFIALFSSREQASDPIKNRGIVISLKDARNGQQAIERGWAEITGKFRAVPTGTGKFIPCLTEIQKIDELPEGHDEHSQ